MSRLVWGEPGKRLYETGIDRGVFYPVEGVGVPWNGLIAVSEAPSGADLNEGYYDGQKFRQQRQSESFSAKLSAYTYPQEFQEYDGQALIGHIQQRRKMFNLSYRTTVGNDFSPDSSHLIHLVYNAIASPTSRGYSTIGAGSQTSLFEWQLETVAEFLPSGESSAHIVINTAIAYPWAVAAFEDIIYGSSSTEPRFPSINEVITLFENASILRITDNGDGTFTADGLDDIVKMIGTNLWQIGPWPSVVQIDTHTYHLSSL